MQAFDAVLGRVDDIAVLAQSFAQVVGETTLVFDDQYSHTHPVKRQRISLPRNCRAVRVGDLTDS